MAYYSPCGGGYGSPFERDPAKVLDDVLDGFCSPQDAADVYGVVLDLDAETVNLAATELRRASMEAR
jgi:N-methylhydantoinase B